MAPSIQPALVGIDPTLLATLQRREFRAGLYEVVKYGVIASRPLFDRVSSMLSRFFARDMAALVPVIAESCAIKASIVDERRAGSRVAAAPEFRTHGRPRARGRDQIPQVPTRRGRRLRHAGRRPISLAKRGTLDGADYERLSGLITQMGPLPAVADLSIAPVLDAVGRDKKVVDGRLHFVLPTALGSCEVVRDVTEDEIVGALQRLGLQP